MVFSLEMFWVLFVLVVSSGLHIHGQRCRTTCGGHDIKFPFGIDEECGDPFHRLNCENGNLTISLADVKVPIDAIEYDNSTSSPPHLIINTTYISDKLNESNCNIPLDERAYNVADDSHVICFLLPNQGDGYTSSSPDTFIANFKTFHVLYCLYGQGQPYPLPQNQYCYTYNIRHEDNKPADNQLDQFGSTLISYTNVAWHIDEERERKCTACEQDRNGTCGYTPKNNGFVCLRDQGKKSKKRGAIIGGVVAGSALLSAVMCAGWCILQRRKRILEKSWILGGPKPPQNGQFLSSSNRSLSRSNNNYDLSTRFSLRDLEEATDGFSESGRLGDGGFGTVYKGKLRDGRLVAVKKLNPWNAQGKLQFDNEVNILSQVKHPHLVRLYGCCLEGRELLLVYEYVPNGTLYDHIHDGRGGFLDWEDRLIVVAQTAEALAFLHKDVQPPIYHRDVKSTNILIDENFHAKVGDFGLSRLVPSLELTHITTAPQGTPGYLDPDYHQSYQLTDKSDVYSLGVVLMEIVSSQRAVDMSRDRKEINLAALAVSKIQTGQLEKLIDSRLGTDDDPVRHRMVERVAELAFACLSAEKDDRPCMNIVASTLKDIHEEGKHKYIKEMKSTSVRLQPVSDSPTSVQSGWHSSSTSQNDSSSSMGSL